MAFANKIKKQQEDSRAKFALKEAKRKAWAEEHDIVEPPSKIIDREFMNEGNKSKGPNAMEKYLASVKSAEAGAADMNPSSTKAVSMA